VESARVAGVSSDAACIAAGGCFTLHYGAVSGFSSATATQANVDSLTPARTMTLRDLNVVATTAPGSDNVLQVGVSVNDAGGATFTCLVIGAATSCTDGLHAVSVPAGSRISIAVIDNQASGSASFPAESVLVGFRLTSV
jgi:hypothetical protein